ncbi:hypothetical protein FFIC_281280 [Fructobacillus ficulneus]|uniref:Uncharacterized protein n=1 Tax=Fructobacillus ficulneus TaxID=157463 RepID=A0A0K8MHT2_9LACO|nr:hypothetical protein FFIC_281280 [Fructobacillus ficulneus]
MKSTSKFLSSRLRLSGKNTTGRKPLRVHLYYHTMKKEYISKKGKKVTIEVTKGSKREIRKFFTFVGIVLVIIIVWKVIFK